MLPERPLHLPPHRANPDNSSVGQARALDQRQLAQLPWMGTRPLLPSLRASVNLWATTIGGNVRGKDIEAIRDKKMFKSRKGPLCRPFFFLSDVIIPFTDFMVSSSIQTSSGVTTWQEKPSSRSS